MMGRFAIIALLVLAGPASAQSINISFGHTAGEPSATYAAAGVAGTWNAITGISGPAYTLVATDGSPSGVTMTQSPTTTVIAATDPAVTGDDAALLDFGLVTSGAETCLSFAGMKPDTYEVLIYAWLPNQPTVKSRTRQDEAPSTIDVGGAWSGAHAIDVTYARYVVTVDSSGILPAHSGLVPNAPSAALNGIQIRSLSSSPSPDAGIVPPGPDAAMPDAGMNGAAPSPQSGGCSASGGSTGWLLVLGVALFRRRRA